MSNNINAIVPPRTSAPPTMFNTIQHLLVANVPRCTGVIAPYSYPIKPPEPMVVAEEKTKKRKREDSELSFVHLSRDELLKMTSAELEDYVERLKKVRPLTASENREVKRQRRLIKNREYAHTSRQKKKEFVSTMKDEMDELKAENDSLQEQVKELNDMVANLKTRNLALEEENKRLKESMNVGQLTGTSPSSPRCSPRSPSSSVEESDLFEVSQTRSSDASPVHEYLYQSPNSFLQEEPLQPEESLFKQEEPLFRDESLEFPDNSNWLTNPFSTGLFVLAIFFSFGFFLSPFLATPIASPNSGSVLSSKHIMEQPFLPVPSIPSTSRRLCETFEPFNPPPPSSSPCGTEENSSTTGCDGGEDEDSAQSLFVSMEDVVADEHLFSSNFDQSRSNARDADSSSQEVHTVAKRNLL